MEQDRQGEMKMRKLKILVIACTITIMSTMTSFAGWEQQEGGQWRYSDNGVYLTGWQWLDGNNDKVAECYYLDVNGIMAANTTVDNYVVNADGAWTVDGVVQTKMVNKEITNKSDIPTLADITGGTFSNMDMSDVQCGDSTGLPALH